MNRGGETSWANLIAVMVCDKGLREGLYKLLKINNPWMMQD